MRADTNTLKVGATIAAYLCLNSTLNLLIKWTLGQAGGFHFPLLLTCSHMAVGFIVLGPVAAMEPWNVHVRMWHKQGQGVALIGMLMALNISLNNLSLTGISLSLNQIIRSAIPVVTCIIAIFIERRYPSRLELASLIVLTLGVMLAVWQGMATGRPSAIAACLVAMLCNSAMMSVSGKVLSEKLDVVHLTFYTAPVSMACLLPFVCLFELEAFRIYWAAHATRVAFIIGITSGVAVAYNVIHNLTIKHTSAVTTTVLGEVKIIGLLLLSAWLLGERKDFTAKMAVGTVLSVVGFGMYSWAKLSSTKAATQPSAISTDSIELQPLQNGETP